MRVCVCVGGGGAVCVHVCACVPVMMDCEGTHVHIDDIFGGTEGASSNGGLHGPHVHNAQCCMCVCVSACLSLCVSRCMRAG